MERGQGDKVLQKAQFVCIRTHRVTPLIKNDDFATAAPRN